MAMRSDPDEAGSYRMPVARMVHLRIAVPSWRWVGIEMRRRPEPESVSREEILTLFSGELGRKRRRAKLTEREERERDIARSLRRALYPA